MVFYVLHKASFSVLRTTVRLRRQAGLPLLAAEAANTDAVRVVPRRVRWDLAAAWAAVGVTSGIVASDIFTRLALLLIPAGIVAAGLVWKFDASREVGAGLLGLSVGPLLLANRAQDPPCSVTPEFQSCGPGLIWPWLGSAVLLLLIGTAVMLVPWRRGLRQGLG